MIAVTSQCAPIGLDELNSRAALMRRTDRKYPLHAADAEVALATLPSQTRILTIGSLNTFQYDSVYFDTTAYDSYLAAARGRTFRFKVRTRLYADTDLAFLEVKTLEGGKTVKRRIPHDPAELFHLPPETHSFIGECLRLGHYPDVEPTWLRPTLLTSYQRRTFLAHDGQTRLTVDEGLRWRTIGGRERVGRDLVIIETKSPGHSSSMDRYLWSLGHRPGRISKYATGLAALRPHLPANRWHRTLNTYFAN